MKMVVEGRMPEIRVDQDYLTPMAAESYSQVGDQTATTIALPGADECHRLGLAGGGGEIQARRHLANRFIKPGFGIKPIQG
jgi:hypothetical protein